MTPTVTGDTQAPSRRFPLPVTEAGPYQRAAALAHVADVIATAMKIGNSGDPAVPALASDAWAQLGLAPTILSALIDEVERQVHKVALDADARQDVGQRPISTPWRRSGARP